MNTLKKRSRITPPNCMRNPKARAKHLVGLALALLGLTNWIILSGSAFAYKANTATQPGQSGSGVDSTTSASGRIAPLSLNAWSSNGPEAEVLSLAMDPTNPATIYAGTYGSGVFKSTNRGASWSAVNTGLTDPYVIALVINPTNPNIIYAGVILTGGVFKSTNGGASWSFKGLGGSYVAALAADPSNPNNIYENGYDCLDPDSCFSEVNKSTDGGESWNWVLRGRAFAGPLAIDSRNPAAIYMGDFGGILKSTDSGASWNEFNVGQPSTQVNALAIDRSNPNTIYAGTGDCCGISPDLGVFKSTDGGATWNGVGPANTFVAALAADLRDPNAIYAGTVGWGVFKSTDAGASWSPFNDGLTNLFVLTLAIDQSGTQLHAGTGAGVFDYQYSKTPFDFDGDGKTEIAYYRNGLWGVLKSTQGYSYGSAQFFSWGGSGLPPIVADFDGDGKADLAYIVPPSGGQSAVYAILKSTTGYSFAPGQVLFVPAGFPVLGDTPVVGDFDGDGKAEPGIWRSSQGVWIIPLSSANYSSFIFTQWGQNGDVPIVTDIDGDGKADIGFYRNGLWGFLKSSQGYSLASAQFFSWGGAGLAPIVADFDGDGKADICYVVPPGGGQSATYAILLSSRGYSFASGQPLFVPAGFPALGDTPVVGDFDGDGKADPGIWRSSEGVWTIPKSSTNYTSFIFTQWGQAGDLPMPNSLTQN